MAKEPVAGRVKTRLGRDIGMTGAVNWYRHQCRRLIRRLSDDPRWEVRLLLAPSPAALTSRSWPMHIPREGQTNGDLGDRMRHSFNHTPPGPMVLIGTDVPDVTPKLIADAFETLGRKDSVFGPAKDGGFWLVGHRRCSRPLPQNLFKNVRWSCEHTLNDTLQTLGTASYGLVQTLRDVDNASDL